MVRLTLKANKAGAHIPMRVNSLMHSAADGRHTGKAGKGNTSILPKAAEGNGKGTTPPALSSKPGVRGTLESHSGDSGRGGTGRIGKHDNFKGKPTAYTEDISHNAFEKLGAS